MQVCIQELENDNTDKVLELCDSANKEMYQNIKILIVYQYEYWI